MLIDLFERFLKESAVLGVEASWLAALLSVLTLIVLAYIANFIAKKLILRIVQKLIARTRVTWDDVLFEAGVFTRLSHIAPALVVSSAGERFFASHEVWLKWLQIGVHVYVILIVLLIIDAALNALEVLYNRRSNANQVPIGGFIQGAKVLVFVLGAVLILSALLDKSPLYLLSGLGALTAVTMLVFQNAILGFVAGVQISMNRLVQIGDWIEMPKYGADGDVIEVGLTTVRIQNWDKTITTVPTHALIQDPVKNWRAMHESGGRRIKRSIFLDMQTFRFVDEELLEKMKRFSRLRPYLDERLPEIQAWNEEHQEDLGVLVNGRRLTNIGCFRAYVTAYLRSHPHIRQDMTFLVRQLQPTDKGLPLEIYVFTSDTRWAFYEGIQADIFDHLLAVVPEFDLRIYQSPSSADLREAAKHLR